MTDQEAMIKLKSTWRQVMSDTNYKSITFAECQQCHCEYIVQDSPHISVCSEECLKRMASIEKLEEELAEVKRQNQDLIELVKDIFCKYAYMDFSSAREKLKEMEAGDEIFFKNRR